MCNCVISRLCNRPCVGPASLALQIDSTVPSLNAVCSRLERTPGHPGAAIGDNLLAPLMSSSPYKRGRLPDEQPAAQADDEARPLAQPKQPTNSNEEEEEEEESAAPTDVHQPATRTNDVEMHHTSEEQQHQPHRPPASSSTAVAASSNRTQQQPAAEQLNTSRRLLRYRRSPRSACYISGLTSVEVQSIMQLLTVSELLQLARCSRQMRRDADAPQVWRHRTPHRLTRTMMEGAPLATSHALMRHCSLCIDVEAADFIVQHAIGFPRIWMEHRRDWSRMRSIFRRIL
jgi:hypothetical protein